MQLGKDVTVLSLSHLVHEIHCIREASYISGTFKYGLSWQQCLEKVTSDLEVPISSHVASLALFLTMSGEGVDIATSVINECETGLIK